MEKHCQLSFVTPPRTLWGSGVRLTRMLGVPAPELSSQPCSSTCWFVLHPANTATDGPSHQTPKPLTPLTSSLRCNPASSSPLALQLGQALATL